MHPVRIGPVLAHNKKKASSYHEYVVYNNGENVFNRNTREQQNTKKSTARRKGGRTESKVLVATTIGRAAFTAISTTQLSIT